MKFTKILALVLCAVMLLSACGNSQTGTEPTGTAPLTPTGEAEYQVTVVDAFGAPCTSGIIVRFLQNGSQVSMQVVDGNGVAAKTLAAADYEVELEFTGDDAYYYDKTDLKLTSANRALTVKLMAAVSGEGHPLAAPDGETAAYTLGVGGTYAKLTAGERNYFLFAPTQAGTYEFSILEGDASIGYYGAPHFVQTDSAAEVVDGKFTVSISAGMIGTDGTGTTTLVIGVDAGSSEDCVIGIQRIGDAQKTLADEPWTIYEPTVELVPYTLDSGVKLEKFDITAASDAYTLVLGEDGFYHKDSADGALVVVLLGENPEYVDCYKTILEHTGVVKYFFDENGEFVKKESYTECLLSYIEKMDQETGVYPLTQDLMYIIQNHGDHSGWWDVDGSLYLFVDEAGNRVPGVNPEIAWLFMCRYLAD